MNPSRGLGAAAVLARAVEAGIIASSSGRPTVAPRPRRTVRRLRCFFVMNMSGPLKVCGDMRGCSWHLARGFHRDLVLAEGLTVDDREHDRREPVPVLGGIAGDGAHGGQVVV